MSGELEILLEHLKQPLWHHCHHLAGPVQRVNICANTSFKSINISEIIRVYSDHDDDDHDEEKLQKGKHLRRHNISVHVCVCEKLLLWHHRFVFVLTELEKQMKIENLFVTWQQRSAQSNMPISVSLTRFQELSKDIIKPQNDVNSKELFINRHL